MPTYQYACTECDHAFEQFQSFSDDALTVCPVCQGRLRKVFNAVGVVFKGSGFYRTDSRTGSGSDSKPATKTGSEGSDGSGSSDKKPSGDTSGSGAGGSTDKPATKSDTSSGSTSAA